MRVFVAGATGVIGQFLVPGLVAAGHDVIIHQMTSLTSMRSLRNFDKTFAVTNELRSEGTDYLLEAAQRAGVRRFIAQSFIDPMLEAVRTRQMPVISGGASNAKARRELGWAPAYPSWRDGFPVWARDLAPGKAA